MRDRPAGLFSLLVLALGRVAAAGSMETDSALPTYVKASGISGNLSSIGSDTLNNLMTLWAEGFRRQYPNVRIQVEGKGSSTAPPALTQGTAQLGPMSRAMKPSEIEAFERHYGYEPTQVRVAIDALAVYVHKDNPLERLTLPQIDAVFSKLRRCGAGKDLTRWGGLGLTGNWATRPISLYGRNSASGTYGYFKEHALCNGDFKDTVKEQPGSSAVVNGVTEDLYGIGYSGIGYRTSSVKALAIAKKESEDFVAAEAENVYDGRYPLSRFLFIYFNRPSGRPLDPLVREFLRYVLSQEGQMLVIKDGYMPLKQAVADQDRVRLE